jgi:aspartokinase/homoserine dehydrogenase 1
MKVMKFGGSSIADPGHIRNVIAIVTRSQGDEECCVVLSAMKGVTDQLLTAATLAADGNDEYRSILAELVNRHESAVRDLVVSDNGAEAVSLVTERCHELSELLHGVRLVRECTPRTRDLIVGFGERLSCLIVAEALRDGGLPARYVDARRIIRTDDVHGNAGVDFEATYRLIHRELSFGSKSSDRNQLPVVTGFIASTADGVATTLGRNGSDYTASLVGAGIGADAIEIWTDVDGVYSADPRYVADAFVLPEISYREAMELSYFGAEVIHPYTMVPAVEKGIPLWIRNTHRPEVTGTLIAAHTAAQSHAITGIASVEGVALINVEGGGMVGSPGVAGRIFTALADARINIIMISQASSEHSICFVVRDAEAPAAKRAIEGELTQEIQRKQIERLAVETKLEIVAVIGENMRGRPGISGRLFNALGEAGVNVLAIAQGSSEMNISFVVAQQDRKRTLETVHAAFFGRDGQ